MNSDFPLIELSGVGYEAGGVRLLDDINWRLEVGHSWAILGPNGAGKTLLLRLVAGKLWPNAGGEIRRQGKKLVDLRQLSRHIGWVSAKMIADIPPDEVALNTVVSGRFAQLGLKPVAWDHPEPEDFDRAEQILARLRCEQLARKPFGVLSQGEQQKILLARALTIDPLAIILDEPCSSLDPGARERFLETMQALLQSKQSPALLLVTHHVEEIVPELKRVLVLHQGKVIKQGRTSDVLTLEMLGLIYGRQPQQLTASRGRFWPVW
jgi:iron complex transport system ATP-binding protein